MKKFSGILFALVLVVSLTLVPAFAGNDGPADTASDWCTNIIVDTGANGDSSTIGSYCCDGPGFAKIRVVPGKVYRPGAMMTIPYRPNFYPFTWPVPLDYDTYLEYIAEEPQVRAEIPQVRETNTFIELMVALDDEPVGGMNEYGVTIGETTIGGSPDLMNSNGLFYGYGTCVEDSLIALGLQRGKTAKEAIEVMGSLAEDYGYLCSMEGVRSGENLTVTDGNEAWVMEIFGPGEDWTPGCGDPGAVWCAQRIPDGHVGVSANRSRIGEVPVEEDDYFMFSPNIRDLAEDMSWWDGEEPFIWHDAYAPSDHPNLREWEALNWFAPSLGLDPDTVYLPFSVVPDYAVTVQDVMALHRDYYQGTAYDITQDGAWLNKSGYHVGEQSAMTCPWGPRALHDLIGVSAPRSIGTPSSIFSYVAQVRADLPDPIKGCMWFGFGPAATTCYVPIYSGVTKLPKSWGDVDFTQVNRADSFWAFPLVHNLSLIEYQNTIEDIEGVRDPAEACFFEQQPDMEDAVLDLYDSRRSEVAAEKLARKLVTKYSCASMNAVSDGYWELVDYMLYKYYSQSVLRFGMQFVPPSIDCPPVPTNPGKGKKGK